MSDAFEIKVTRVVVVSNPEGLHLRAATLVAEKARAFVATRVVLVTERDRVEATDVLQLLTMGVGQGCEIVLEAIGPEAEQAIAALGDLFSSQFGEQPTTRP